ncbi:LamG domain-containing protein, partial [Planctomycetota bacterium]
MFRKLVCLATFIFILASASDTRGDLVAHWKLDERSGDVVHDLSGNGNDGTFKGNPQWMDGKIGGAMEFNGSSGYVEIPFSESLRVINQGDFSIAAWFMLNEIPSEYKVVFQQGDDTSGGPGRTWLFVHQSNEIRSSLGGAPTGSGVGIEGGIWYHGIVVVTEGGDTDSVQIYVDGQAAGAPREDSMEDSEGVFYIGAHKGLGNIWDGLLDDIRIYNHALTETQILAAMEGSEDFPYAFGPNPADGALHPDTWVTLSWSPGDFAVSHDVYLGDRFDEVDNGTGDTFRGNQTSTMFIAGFPGFAYPDGLVPGTTYYWRIDEVNDADPNSPWKGPIWSFSIPPKTAYNPDPADGAEFVDPNNATLTWTPGFGAILHTAYFGDNYDEVSNATGGAPLGSATYNPGPLELEKVYYW